MVAAWKGDTKDASSNLLSVLFFLLYFESEGRCMVQLQRREILYNSVYTNKKKLTPLMYYNYLTKNQSFILFSKHFIYRNINTPSPFHSPSFAHDQCRNLEKRFTQLQRLPLFVGLSLIISLWLRRNCES